MRKRPEKSWFRPKAYEHFTKRLGKKDRGFVHAYVSNQRSVSNHAFLPLIHTCIRERKFKKLDDGSRSHRELKNGVIKSTAKKRQIYYATHLDSQIFSYYSNKVLGPKYEALLKEDSELDKCVLAYRKIKDENGKGKGNVHFAKEVFDYIKTQDKCTAMAFDISKFFDSLNHKLLKQIWSRLLKKKSLPKDHFNLYKALTRFHFVELGQVLDTYDIKHANELKRRESEAFCKDIDDFKKRFLDNGQIRQNPFTDDTGKRCGIPQGTPISAMLANLYLIEFDRKVLSLLDKHGSGLYRRYSDDLVIVCNPAKAKEIEASVMYEIKEICKLEIHPNKTKKHYFDGKQQVFEITQSGELIAGIPLQYLGFEFDGRRPILKSSSLGKFYRKMKKGVRGRAWRASIAKIKKRKNPTTETKLYKSKLYSSFSHLGKYKRRGNYLTYAYRAADIMEEPRIRKQVAKSWQILNKRIVDYQIAYDLPT